MTTREEFYAVVREHSAAARALMDAAVALLREGPNNEEAADLLLQRAKAEQDAMIADMQRMNAEQDGAR